MTKSNNKKNKRNKVKSTSKGKPSNATPSDLTDDKVNQGSYAAAAAKALPPEPSGSNPAISSYVQEV